MNCRGLFQKNFFWIFLVGFFVSCNPSTDQKQAIENKPAAVLIKAPEFNADSAFGYVKAQTDFGPRAMNSSAHEACGEYLESFLKGKADRVIVQKVDLFAWDKKKLKVRNIIASFDTAASKRLLLCSHWDSRNWADQDSSRKDEPISGANDGASGVGVLMEIARILKEKKPGIGVDIILFDAEDYGQPENSGKPQVEESWCMGSQYWARHPHVPGYAPFLGILLDMVGGNQAVFTQEGNSRQYAQNWVNKIWETGHNLGYSSYFSYLQTPPIIDDHYYINTIAGIPCVDIIQFDESSPSRFYKHWHTHRDVIDHVSPQTLKAVGQTLLGVIFNP